MSDLDLELFVFSLIEKFPDLKAEIQDFENGRNSRPSKTGILKHNLYNGEEVVIEGLFSSQEYSDILSKAEEDFYKSPPELSKGTVFEFFENKFGISSYWWVKGDDGSMSSVYFDNRWAEKNLTDIKEIKQ